MEISKIKEQIILKMVCKKCDKTHVLTRFDENFFCECGFQLIEYTQKKLKLTSKKLDVSG